jgi:hypothetical protein
MTGDFRHTPSRQRDLMLAGQLAGQSFNLHHDFWGEKTGGGPVAAVLGGRASVR